MPLLQDLQSAIERATGHLRHDQNEYQSPIRSLRELAQTIDHTLLKIDANEAQIDLLCEEAKRYNFRSVCVRSQWVQRTILSLRGSDVRVACVIGFHEGTYRTDDKASEAAKAVKDGASELDMVINHGLLRSGRLVEVYEDLVAVRKEAHGRVTLKVILETSQLSDYEIIAACVISEIAAADFVKTSTGFCGQGATLGNVRLMKSVVGDRLGVKASGGIRSWKESVDMLEAGASRIGTSNGVTIMEQAKAATTGEADQAQGEKISIL